MISPGFAFHEIFLLPMGECMVGRKLNIIRVSKKYGTSTNRTIRSGRPSVLSGPRVDGFEENSVRFEQIGIRKLLDLREALKGGINAGQECGMLKVPDNLRIFFFSDIAQVALRFKIPERVECHCLASRR
jgi:hypothetical protein